MTSQQCKDRIMRAVEHLGDDEVAQVLKYVESLGGGKGDQAEEPYRPLGLYRGQIHVDPSFYDPLPQDILDAFEGKND